MELKIEIKENLNGTTSYLDSLTPLCIVMLRGFTYAAAMSYEYGGDLDINTIFLIIDHPFCLNFNQAQINQSFF